MANDLTDLDTAIEASRQAVLGVINGNPSAIHALFSESDDVSLGNPFGPFVKGREAVLQTTARAATRYQDGVLLPFELISRHQADGLAVVVETEHVRAKLEGATQPSDLSLRVTSVYRQEDSGWRLLHRHADPITTPRTLT
ncbi:MAG: YybH family protein [Acidimicrobiales bacterium]